MQNLSSNLRDEVIVTPDIVGSWDPPLPGRLSFLFTQSSMHCPIPIGPGYGPPEIPLPSTRSQLYPFTFTAGREEMN